MKEKEFRDYIEQFLEKHTPTYFIDEEYLKRILDALCSEPNMSRRQIVMLAYSIGADENETNKLLNIKGYDNLYSKNREDAIWKFALRMRTDLTGIIERIFTQDVD